MYSNYKISDCTPEDIPSLKALWQSSFDDPPELIDCFFELLPGMGVGLKAECGDELVGAVYILDAEMWIPGRRTEKLGLLYALAVEPAAGGSGIGSELICAAKRRCYTHMISVTCAVPTSPSLYGYFKKCSGIEPVSFYRTEELFPGEDILEISEVFEDEYCFSRTDILMKKRVCFVNPDFNYIRYQAERLRSRGGGFYAYKGGLVCGYIRDGVFVVQEAIDDAPEFIPALCTRLGVRSASVRRPAPDGTPYIAAYPTGDFPSGTVYNLTLE